jgi:hypothetical protein
MGAKLPDIIRHISEGALLNDDEGGFLGTANDYLVMFLIYYGRQSVEADLIKVHLLVHRVFLEESWQCIHNFQ